MKNNTTTFTKTDVTPWEERNLEGKLLILKGDDPKNQLVLALFGNGCTAYNYGTNIYVTACHNDEPQKGNIDRNSGVILGIATPEAIEKWKAMYGEFNERVADTLALYKELAKTCHNFNRDYN